MKEYLILSQKDKWFSGRFDAVVLQQVINEHARQGWIVKAMTSTSREGMVLGGDRDELLVLLERDAVRSTTPAAPVTVPQGGLAKRFSAPPPADGPEPDVYKL